MKNFNRFVLVAAAIVLGVLALFLDPIASDQPSFSSESRLMKLPRAERMVAKRAYFKQLYQDPNTKEVPLWSPLQKQRLINKFEEQVEFRGPQNNLVWEEAGPNNVGGRTRAIALDRRDSKVVITGGVRGGIWKSTDNGENWKHIPGCYR